jgi:alkylation response protein AidB-like acyl-CoA dehydrogenase
MDFRLTEEQEKFRKEIRDFLEVEMKQGLWKPSIDSWIMAYDPEFTKRVAAKGWIGLTWPKEYGGQGRCAFDRLILTEEMLRYGAPAACHWFADRQIGGSVLKHGTEQQKREILPKIMRGEMYVGLGMSEPEAGCDLASLKTQAIKKDGHYVINGQKTWTSGGKHMNYLYLLARTDLNVAKHQGLSEFIIPKDLPGITTNPIIDITGNEAWNEVFFENAQIPEECRIGKENNGWRQVMEQLAFERSGMERLMANYSVFEGIIQLVKETKQLRSDAVIRNKLAQLKIEFDIGRLFMYRVALVIDEGRAPEWEAAMSKAFATAFEQRLANAALEILGPYGQLAPHSKLTKLNGMAYHSYLSSKGYSLQAGTTEVLKNIIALRKLGMPAG